MTVIARFSRAIIPAMALMVSLFASYALLDMKWMARPLLAMLALLGSLMGGS